MPTPLPATASAAADVLHARSAPPRSAAARTDEVFYPSSDGKPMAENMWQAEAIMNAASDLKMALPQALVAADILMYPEEGNRYNNIAPDVLVAFGLNTHKRMTYRVWEEGKPPDWVLEVASPSTEEDDRRRNDRKKRGRYAEMGVPEYWLFDPTGDVYTDGTPRLLGLKLVRGEYRPLASRLVAGERVIRSKVLGLDVLPDGELLRFRDSATGLDVRHRCEDWAAAEQEAAARAAAEVRIADAEAEIAELRAALRRSRAGDPP